MIEWISYKLNEHHFLWLFCNKGFCYCVITGIKPKLNICLSQLSPLTKLQPTFFSWLSLNYLFHESIIVKHKKYHKKSRMSRVSSSNGLTRPGIWKLKVKWKNIYQKCWQFDKVMNQLMVFITSLRSQIHQTCESIVWILAVMKHWTSSTHLTSYTVSNTSLDLQLTVTFISQLLSLHDYSMTCKRKRGKKCSSKTSKPRRHLKSLCANKNDKQLTTLRM